VISTGSGRKTDNVWVLTVARSSAVTVSVMLVVPGTSGIASLAVPEITGTPLTARIACGSLTVGVTVIPAVARGTLAAKAAGPEGNAGIEVAAVTVTSARFASAERGSAVSATEWDSPAATAMTARPARMPEAFTATGTRLLEVELFPS